MSEQQTRRKYLLTLGTTSVIGLAGCSQITDFRSENPENRNLSSADFSFDYHDNQKQAVIRYDGGADIVAGDLQIRSSTGLEVRWPQLGSTVASPEDLIEPGAAAVLNETILNWGEPVARDETIRLVHIGGDAPATLGRFTPSESSTLTSTVPPTDVSTEGSGTSTQVPDTTAPSITAFSLSNPSGRELRTSFESDEELSSIEVTISGTEAVTLTMTDFSESVSGGTHTYEATYQANSDGDYTATLNEATDGNGNDGAENQSVTLSIASQSNILFSDNFDDGTYDDVWNVTREHDVESVTEENGVFTYNSPISETIYEPDMTVITDQTISGTGTQIFEAEFRIESYRRIRVFRLLDQNSDDNISLNEEEQNGSFVLSLPDDTITLDDDLGDGSWRTYQMEIDFDSNRVVSVTRGDETYTINESFGSGFEQYKLGIGEGNGKSQFESISVHSTSETNISKTLADFENGLNDFEILINEAVEGHPQQGTDANAERTTDDAYIENYSLRVQCSMNGNDGDVVARRGNVSVSEYSTLSAWSKLLVGNKYGSPRIRIYDSTDDRVGNLDIRNQQQGEWEKASFDISDEDSITIHLEASSGAGAEQEALIDYLRLTE